MILYRNVLINILKRALGKRVTIKANPPAREARLWSNREIKKLARYVTGDVINVSAWFDEDKEGANYRNYFAAASSYSISNYKGWRGEEVESDYLIDLQRAPPADLVGKFDLIFNHTTLEHIYDIHQAFRTMASLTHDAMLVIVPFMQHLHGPEDGDFWRPSPYAMRRMFNENGLEVLYESAGPKDGKIRYLCYFAARNPSSWISRLPEPTVSAVDVLRRPPL